MRREIRRPGLRQGIAERVTFERLQRVAQRAPAAVVDDKRYTAVFRYALAECVGDGLTSGA